MAPLFLLRIVQAVFAQLFPDFLARIVFDIVFISAPFRLSFLQLLSISHLHAIEPHLFLEWQPRINADFFPHHTIRCTAICISSDITEPRQRKTRQTKIAEFSGAV